MVDKNRESGSISEFEQDWQNVLAGNKADYFVVPSYTSGRQVDLLEWIKVSQVEQLLQGAGICNGRMLEYGCGAAGVSLYFAQRGYETHVCDLSEKALRVALLNQERNFAIGELASASRANVFELPYADNSFDAVMSYGLLEHFSADALRGLLTETIRVLRPGGLFVADIVPGPERWNVRTFGTIANWVASSVFHVAKGHWHCLGQLRQHYFDHYFETIYDDQTWAAILTQHPLEDIRVDVCRPFPVLAISGLAEDCYTAFLRKMLVVHNRFDGANTWLTRKWGWMYLASGRKQSLGNAVCASR